MVLNSHYRSKLNFTWKSLGAAENALNNIKDEIITIIFSNDKNDVFNKKSGNGQVLKTHQGAKLKLYKDNFKKSLNDDLNTPKALAVLHKLVNDYNLEFEGVLQALKSFDRVLGLGIEELIEKTRKGKKKDEKSIREVEKLLKQREKLRTNKQFIQADRLRKKIEALGYRIEDTVSGPRVRKKL